MKRLYLLFTIIFAFGILNAQETYRFRTDAPQGFSIESSTASGLSLHYVLNEITVANYKNGNANGQEIVMKGSFGSFAEGLPNLPFENRYIAVPQGAKVSIKVKENGCKTLTDIDLLPAAEVVLNSAVGLPELRKDMSVFGKDANFPSENVSIAQTTQIRGLDVVMLNVTPFRYNPVKKTLEVIYNMDIDIRFEGGDGQFGEARYRNPSWDNILRDLVINSDMLPEANYYERLNKAIQSHEEGCEYLIIAPDDSAFLAWADTLKQFRTKQGILTKVATTTDCGGNEPENIRNYILNAYVNWAIPPAAVLMFGGNNLSSPEIGLKPFIYSIPKNAITTYLYPTDNPIADMNGDSIPDVAISRMVVYNANECQQQVEKLINYELNPPTDPHYYDHPVISSGYEEDKWFTITSQSVNSFFCNKLDKHTTNNYMVFDQMVSDPIPPDSIWSTATNTSAVLNYFGPNGTNYIPLSIGALDNWSNMSNIMPLVDAVNEESFFLLYRDHSSQGSWCCPWFNSSDFYFLDNKKPSFIFSIGCLTNNYWDEWAPGLSESFLKEKVGAIGVIGASSITISHYNDLITWGTFDHFWPEFMPTLGSQTQPDFTYPSYALVAGKLFLRQQAFLPYNASDPIRKIEKTLNLFSYLGETYLNLYTEVPQQMEIEAGIYSNSQSQYTITAEEGATICLSSGEEILAIAQATGHPQNLELPTLPIGERFHVTVTKQNRFRWEKDVVVISPDLAFVYLKDFSINDQDGNSQLDYGEYAEIHLTLSNANPIISGNGEVTLLSDSPYIEILQGTATYPSIEPDAELNVHDAFRIRLSDDVPDQTLLHLKVQFNEGQNTHHDVITVTANAPVINIEPEFRPMTAEGEPSTHIATEGRSKLAFTVTNEGHSSTRLLNASLEIKAPFVEVETEQLQMECLAPNETCPFTFELNTTSNAITGAWLQLHLLVQHLEEHHWFDTIVQYGGIFENFETDTLNPFFLWTNGGSHPWIYCDEDVHEGQRCLMSTANTQTGSVLKARLRASHVGHDCKISFHYKTDYNEEIQYFTNLHDIYTFSDTEWQYAEMLYNGRDLNMSWRNWQLSPDCRQAKLDDICFPPLHTTIAYAGSDIIACDETPIVPFEAYAYDCDSILWTTDGDGYFDNDTVAVPIYYPTSQDMTSGIVTLTLTAFGNDTIVSSMQIRFADEVNLGEIAGDSLVNKYIEPVSHYSVENPESLHHSWFLEPANAGTIYGHGDAIDILWNPHEGDAEVTLWAWANHGCASVSKQISLIGYSTPEWQLVSFDLFPNPTDGNINLVIGETLQGKAVVEVYNLLGERMMAKNVHNLQKGETFSLDLSHLVSGLYIIKLNTENGSCSRKVSVR